MIRNGLLLLAMAAFSALQACGGGTEEEAAPEDSAAERSGTEQTEALPEGSAPEPALQPDEEGGDAGSEGSEAAFDGPELGGTSWNVGEYSLWFQPFSEVEDGTGKGKVRVKGGDVPEVMQDGILADYSLTPEGNLIIQVPGQGFSGRYDGSELIIDGVEGTRMEEAS